MQTQITNPIVASEVQEERDRLLAEFNATYDIIFQAPFNGGNLTIMMDKKVHDVVFCTFESPMACFSGHINIKSEEYPLPEDVANDIVEAIKASIVQVSLAKAQEQLQNDKPSIN